MNVQEYINNRSNRNRSNKFLNKVLISLIILVSVFLLSKNNKVSTFIKDSIMKTNFNFSKINNIYKKYIGLFDNKSEMVSNNNLIDYSRKEKFNDGVKLYLEDDSLISALESGIVIFIGEKKDLGNTIIVQQINGVDTTYSNIKNVNVKLYDYVEKGEGICASYDEVILYFQKDGKYLDYNNFIF